MVRVVIAEDHHVVRQGIRALLERAGDIAVVGEAIDGREALELVKQCQPDVLVMDVAMPHLNGLEVLRRIGQLGVPTQTVILSVHADDHLVREALRTGAKSYVLKRSLVKDLLQAIRCASRGETFVDPETAGHIPLGSPNRSASSTALQRLSPREREVLQLVAEGHTSRQIALKLAVSEKTIEKHRASLMRKLNVRDVTGLVRFAIRHHLVFLEKDPQSALSE